MDLIGGIKYVENRLGGRNPSQSRAKSAQKNARNEAPEEVNASVIADNMSAEGEILLGRKVDTTA